MITRNSMFRGQCWWSMEEGSITVERDRARMVVLQKRKLIIREKDDTNPQKTKRKEGKNWQANCEGRSQLRDYTKIIKALTPGKKKRTSQ